MSRSTIDYRDGPTSSVAPQPSALPSPASKTVQGWRERSKKDMARSRTEHRATGFIVRRIVPVPVLEGRVVLTPVIDGELDGRNEPMTILRIIRRRATYCNRLSWNLTLRRREAPLPIQHPSPFLHQIIYTRRSQSISCEHKKTHQGERRPEIRQHLGS